MFEGLRKKSVSWIGWRAGALFAVAVIAIVPALSLGSWCSISEPGEHYVGSHIPIEAIQAEDEGGTPTDAGSPSRQIAPPPDTEKSKVHSVETADYAANDVSLWWKRFLCEINGADYVLAVFTIVLAASTALLWLETRRLALGADDQAEKMADSIAEAARAAGAAERSARVAEDSLALYERPWLFVDLDQTIYDEGDTEPFVLFDIVNHGRTPAIIDYCLAEARVWFERPSAPKRQEQWRGTIGPGHKMARCKLQFPLGVDYGSIIDAQTGLARRVPHPDQDHYACFYINVGYHDISGKTHVSSFCWRYSFFEDAWRKFDGADYNYTT